MQPRTPKTRRWLLRVLKLAITCAVAGVIASQISWSDQVRLDDGTEARLIARNGQNLLLEHASTGKRVSVDAEHCLSITPGVPNLLRAVRLDLLIVACGIHVAVLLLLTARWKLLSHAVGERVTFFAALIWMFRAQAIGAASIGQLGSDAIRMQQAISGGHKAGNAITVIVAERIIGLFALVCVSAYGFCVLYQQNGLSLVALGVLAIMTFAAVMVLPIIPRCLNRARTWRSRNKTLTTLSQFAEDSHKCISQLRKQPTQLATAVLLTIGIHLSTVALYVAVDRALGCGQPWPVYLAAVPVVSLILCIPNLSGLILFEGSMVVLLTRIGQLSTGQTLAICATLRLIELALRGIQGAAIWIRPTPPAPRDLRSKKCQSRIRHSLREERNMSLGMGQ